MTAERDFSLGDEIEFASVTAADSPRAWVKAYLARVSWSDALMATVVVLAPLVLRRGADQPLRSNTPDARTPSVHPQWCSSVNGQRQVRSGGVNAWRCKPRKEQVRVHDRTSSPRAIGVLALGAMAARRTNSAQSAQPSVWCRAVSPDQSRSGQESNDSPDALETSFRRAYRRLTSINARPGRHSTSIDDISTGGYGRRNVHRWQSTKALVLKPRFPSPIATQSRPTEGRRIAVQNNDMYASICERGISDESTPRSAGGYQ